MALQRRKTDRLGVELEAKRELLAGRFQDFEGGIGDFRPDAVAG
jgi:hypothetical protein